jgi:hypothetical protein
MFCALGSKLSNLIAWMKPKKTQPRVVEREVYEREVVVQHSHKNPWQDSLLRLAQERPSEFGRRSPSSEGDKAKSFIDELAQSIDSESITSSKEKRSADGTLPNAEDAKPLPAKKKRRTMDGTVQDIKAWYGQALSTWEPLVNDKTLDAEEQRRRAQYANKWFQ